MENWRINQMIDALVASRKNWLEILARRNGYYDDACKHIISINSKIELLASMWNWADDSEEMYKYY